MVAQSMTKFVDKLKIADGDTVYVVGLYYTVYYIEGNIGGGILGRMIINSPKQFLFWIKNLMQDIMARKTGEFGFQSLFINNVSRSQTND